MYEIKINSKTKNKDETEPKEISSNPPKEKKKSSNFLKTAISLVVVITLSTIFSTVMMHATDSASFSETLLGSAFRGKSEAPDSRCPEGMSYISSGSDSFCIDTYTASAGKDCPNVEPSSRSETAENLSAFKCTPVSKSGAMPWINISQTQAQEACQKVGKYLPKSENWFYASRGTPTEEPWNESDCNLDNNWEVSPGLTGSADKCVSYAGVYDMVGNVWEWIDETVRGGEMEGMKLPETGYITSVDANGLVLKTDSEKPDNDYNNDRFWINPEGTRGVMRGGFFGSGTDGGVYSTHAEMTPDFAGRAVGFRCASEVLR